MDSIKEVQKHAQAAETKIAQIIADLDVKIKHKIINGKIEFGFQDGAYHVALNVDIYDTIKPKSNIVDPSMVPMK